MKDDSMKFDELTIDTATKEQLNEHSQTMKKDDEDDVEMENEADMSGEEEEEGIEEDKDDVVNKVRCIIYQPSKVFCCLCQFN